jgi:hypothetical protein
MSDRTAATPQSDILADFVYRVRQGGVLRLDERDHLGTLCLSHDVCVAIADIVESSIGIKKSVAPNGLITISKIAEGMVGGHE